MNADVKGALAQIDHSYKAFNHKGNPMTKREVEYVLNYALSKGYRYTSELSDEEVDSLILKINIK